MRCRFAMEAPKPCLLPEDETSGFAPIMGRSIAAVVLQVDGTRHLSTADTQCGITGLVSPFANPHGHAAILKHLRHEWQLVQLALGVQCCENLLLRSYLHPFARAEPGGVIHGGLHSGAIVEIW